MATFRKRASRECTAQKVSKRLRNSTIVRHRHELAGLRTQVVILNLLVQRIAVDAEPCGSSGLHTLTLPQHLQQQLFSTIFITSL